MDQDSKDIKRSEGTQSGRTRRRREQVISVAQKLMKERGYDAVSVNEVAEIASISVGGLYRYIGTKSDLLEMICDEINLGVIPEMRKAAAAQTDQADKLRAAFSVYWNRVWDYASSISVAYREYIHFPEEFKQRHTKEQADIANTFAEIIRSGISDGTFAEVDAYVLSYQMLLLSHIRVLKGWALREYDKMAIFEENIHLVLARLRLK